MMKRHFANEETPVTTIMWTNVREQERKNLVADALKSVNLYADLEVINAPKDGRVVVRTSRNIPSNERGLFFLELEAMLKKRVDVGITIWCEPVGDKSKLRKLRGVTFGNRES